MCHIKVSKSTVFIRYSKQYNKEFTNLEGCETSMKYLARRTHQKRINSTNPNEKTHCTYTVTKNHTTKSHPRLDSEAFFHFRLDMTSRAGQSSMILTPLSPLIFNFFLIAPHKTNTEFLLYRAALLTITN